MTYDELIAALKRMATDTGGLDCLGCGHEHNCGIHGCKVLQEAVDRLEQLDRAMSLLENTMRSEIKLQKQKAELIDIVKGLMQKVMKDEARH